MPKAQIFSNMRIELLTKDNYDTWKIQVEALLTRNQTWSYVSGAKIKPEVTDDAAARAVAQTALDKWISEDKLAKSDLILSISSSQLKHIRNCGTSSELWRRLESIYASQGPTRKATLLEQLSSQKMSEDEDVQDYLSRFMSTVDNLQQMSIEINSDLFSIMLLHSLPSSFNNFCCAIKSRDTLPTIDTLMWTRMLVICSCGKSSTSEKIENPR